VKCAGVDAESTVKCAGVDAESSVAATVRREEFEIGSKMRGGIGRLVSSA